MKVSPVPFGHGNAISEQQSANPILNVFAHPSAYARYRYGHVPTFASLRGVGLKFRLP